MSGALADRLARDPRWYGWLSAIVSALHVPFGVGFLLAPSSGAALLSFVPFYVAAQMYVGLDAGGHPGS
ncbi:MAG: hypothetical protein U0610_07335 [bacterium]